MADTEASRENLGPLSFASPETAVRITGHSAAEGWKSPTSDPSAADVRWLLTLPSLKAGAPRVVAGSAGLGSIVRWLHVGEYAKLGYYLRGGEVILTWGLGLGDSADERNAYVSYLVECGVSGLILELGHVFTEPPPDLLAACESVSLPLIVLECPVAFVEVTHEAHTALVDSRVSELSLRAEMETVYSREMLSGATVDDLLQLLSDQTSNPVVLVDHSTEIIGRASRGLTPVELSLAAAEPSDRALDIPLPSARGQDLGWRVMVLPLMADLSQASVVAANEAAKAVTFALLRDRGYAVSTKEGPHAFLLGLLDSRQHERTAALHAAQLKFDADFYVPVSLLLGAGTGKKADDIVFWNGLVKSVQIEASKIGLRMLMTPTTPGVAYAVLGMDVPTDRRQLIEALQSVILTVCKRTKAVGVPTLLAGGQARSWRALGESMRETADAVPYVLKFPGPGLYDVTEPDIARLLWSLREDTSLRRFVADRLGPVLDHDDTRSTRLLPTLAAFCRNGGRKSDAARQLHIERPSLYDRLNRLATLLGLSWRDAEGAMGVHLAVLALDLGVVPLRKVASSKAEVSSRCSADEM